MSRRRRHTDQRGPRDAAVYAAFFCLAAVPAAADPITLRSADGGVAVTGQLLAHDGDVLTLQTDAGRVSLWQEGLTCDGADCPDDAARPELRVAVQGKAGHLLIPALLEAYRRDTGTRLDLALRDATADDLLDGFPARPFDLFLSPHPLSARERDRARAAGLGDLASTRQGQVLAIDALVPVVAADQRRDSIPIGRLVQRLSGAPLAAADTAGAMKLHLLEATGPDLSWLLPEAARLDAGVTWHPDDEALAAALSADPDAVGVVPASRRGSWKRLDLSGPCGLQARATPRTIRTEDYPLTYPVYLYRPPWRPHPAIAGFLDWLRGEAAQLVVRRAGLVDLGGVPIRLEAQGRRLANAIRMAGGEVTLDELQRLVTAMDRHARISNTFRFAPGSTRLSAPSRSHIMLLAKAIRDGRYHGRDIRLVGFSDGRGPADANRDLAAARAEAVKEDLMQALGGDLPFNVGLATDAFGEAMPLSCDDTPMGQRANRRVEMWVQPRR
jgi:phosphate transport system substrate-binding protein